MKTHKVKYIYPEGARTVEDTTEKDIDDMRFIGFVIGEGYEDLTVDFRIEL